MGFEKSVYLTQFIAAVVIAPLLYAYFGRLCLAGFAVGCALGFLSFFSLLKTSYVLIPETSEKKAGKKEKLIIAGLYVAKMALFILTFWFLSKSGVPTIAGFIGGFSTLLPALMIGGIAAKKK